MVLPNTIKGIIGQKVRLLCNTDLPALWYFNGFSIQNDADHEIIRKEKSIQIVITLTQSNSGIYVCFTVIPHNHIYYTGTAYVLIETGKYYLSSI